MASLYFSLVVKILLELALFSEIKTDSDLFLRFSFYIAQFMKKKTNQVKSMNITYLAILALTQGLTEFLPVSSSAHLILIHQFFGEIENAVELDIAVHFGSLLAVMLYFRNEVRDLFIGAFDILRLNFTSRAAQLTLKLIIATIPVMTIGLLIDLTGWVDYLRDPKIIAFSMIFFGIWLYYFDRFSPTNRDFEDFNYRDAILMGLWQALALIPGTSRSGATITASRLLGFDRESGAKIAMLMSIPTILAASLLLILKLNNLSANPNLGAEVLISVVLSFLAAYFSLAVMMKFLKNYSYTPYVIYRIILGCALLYILF